MNMVSHPKISIILTSFNHAKYLREAIDSALNQTFSDFELIIWDDASKDDSWEIIQGYQDQRIKAFRNEEQRRGIFGINKAISEVAQGEYIAIHHSDDVWESEKLEKQVAFLDTYDEIGAVFTNALAIDEKGNPFKDENHFYFKIFDQPNRSRHEWLRFFFEKGNALCHPSVLIRKVCYSDCGLYRYGLAQVGDFDMWVRLCLKHEIHILPEKLVKFRVRDNEANTSGSRPETRSRVMFEFYLVFINYLRIDGLGDLLKVFPEAEKYCSGDNPSLRYAMAMAMLEIRPFAFANQIALQTLFDLLNDSKESKTIPFNVHEFVKLTGEVDPLQILSIERLNQSVTERDAQLVGIQQAIAERDGQIVELQQAIAERDACIVGFERSRSWRITAPLRQAAAIYRRLFKPRAMFASAGVRRAPRLTAYPLRAWRYYRRNGLHLTVKRTLTEFKKYKLSPTAYARIPDNPESPSPSLIRSPALKAIAFYLPQFHPIPENNAWWGEGFTEWTNVKRAKPLFPGHYQPKRPGDLGYYDLRQPEVMRRQIELAKQFGIHGFCFHYYWFSGKRLLERPIEQFLADASLDIPFCLNWANENWTRRWDGQENEVLIAQNHSPEDDIALIRDLLRYFRDPRYIRVDGRPMLLVYRASLLPDIKATLQRWRTECTAQGEAEPFFVMVQSFENHDPKPSGFDAAVQFPPHQSTGCAKISIPGTVPEFQGIFAEYAKLADIQIERFDPRLPVYPCVSPSWDNTARRGKAGTVFIGSTPDIYSNWLRTVGERVIDNFSADRRFVFINAWNEWAEGAYLEPDRDYGYAYLNATSRVLASLSGNPLQNCLDKRHRLKILFIGHDAALAGAQMVLLEQLRWLRKHTAMECYLLLLDNVGKLHVDYQACLPTMACPAKKFDPGAAERFCNGIPDIVFGNTAVAAQVYKALGDWGVPIVSYIHELEHSLRKYTSPKVLKNLVEYSTHIIGASEPVCRNLISRYGIDSERCTVIDAFIAPRLQPVDYERKRQIRQDLGLPAEGGLILGCGTQSWRKGVDLFVDMAERISSQHHGNAFVFCWVGAPELPLLSETKKKIRELSGRLFFPGEIRNPAAYFQAADVFALPSREDPFPLVCLEAGLCEVPIVCFSEAGGMPSLIGKDAGFVVPHGDVETMGQRCVDLLTDEDLRVRLGKRLREKVLELHTTDAAVPRILNLLRQLADKPHPVSVIVPNYNYAKYLDSRLESIVSQQFRDIELILLDDASTDDSLAVLDRWRVRTDARLVINDRNSGSVNRQWQKGLDLAQGQFIWIAEADDLCAPDFLSMMLPAFQDPSVVLAYTLPIIIDENGARIPIDYRDNYLIFASSDKWNASYVNDGQNEICSALAIVNTIPNVSAVVFRKPTDSTAIEKSLGFRCSGDWMFYLHLADTGKIAYVHGAQAWHRRHSQSVVGENQRKKSVLLAEEAARIHQYVRKKYPLPTSIEEKMDCFVKNIYEADVIAHQSES